MLLDCPPDPGTASEQLIRVADLILLPMIPWLLSRRACAEVRGHLDRHHKGKPPIFPVFDMLDRWRSAHRAALDADPAYPAIPLTSAVEDMADAGRRPASTPRARQPRRR